MSKTTMTTNNHKKQINIYIKASTLSGTLSGIGYFTKELTQNLVATDKKNNYFLFDFLFRTKDLPKAPLKQFPNLTYIFIRNMPGRLYYKLFQLGIAPKIDSFFSTKPNLIIYPDFIRLPSSKNIKTWVVIHDLSFIQVPEYSQDKNKKLLDRYVKKSVIKADKIIAVSNSTKQEIIKEYKIPAGKISIINSSIDHDRFNIKTHSEVKRVLKKYKIEKDYILFTGTIEPRKNVAGIIDAYAQLSESIKDKYTLVLAGGKGWKDEEIELKLHQNFDLNIIRTGYVADEDLPALYNGASLFVFPSQYEGWGIPILEAMACGVPVITANNTSLPEVAGDAAIMINAKDTPALTNSIKKVLTNQNLRKKMIQKGFIQAKMFSWQKSAKELKKLIDNEFNI